MQQEEGYSTEGGVFVYEDGRRRRARAA